MIAILVGFFNKILRDLLKLLFHKAYFRFKDQFSDDLIILFYE